LIQTSQPILVTGAAGFIGFHLCWRLLKEGHRVVGLDNLNTYYDVSLKKNRIEVLEKEKGFVFVKMELADTNALSSLFQQYSFEYVVNLAAQAGVRHSLEHPFDYTESNIIGFVNILERCKDHQVKHLVFASSSSVYGAVRTMPFSTGDRVDHPLSLYAATKKANELLAHSYASIYHLPVTGLRFFSVYGPWGRPDMALFIFTKNILEGRPIDVYNHGKMKRDFTYIDDIIEGIFRVLPAVSKADPDWKAEAPNPNTSYAPYRIFNIGNNNPVELMTFIRAIEKEIGKDAILNYMEMQVGDVPDSYADVSDLMEAVGYQPSATVEKGIHEFVKWYRNFYTK